MIKIQGLIAAPMNMNVFTTSNPSFGLAVPSQETQRPTSLRQAAPQNVPPTMNPVDYRPRTMMVLGKRTPGTYKVGRVTKVEDSTSMMPHFGIARGPPGLLEDNDGSVNIRGKIMRQPDSAYAFIPTKLKAPPA